MISRVWRLLKVVLIVFAAAFATLVGLRAWDSQRGPPLEPWHTFVPHELRARAIDAADWPEYIDAENRIFESVRDEVTRWLPARDRIPLNRYFEGSPIYPGHFRQDWTGPSSSSQMASRLARSCSSTGLPTLLTDCGTSRKSTACTASLRSG